MTVSLAPPKVAKPIKKKKTTPPRAQPKSLTAYAAYLRAADANPLLRVELIQEKIHMSPAPRPKHQRIVRQLILLLGQWLKEHDIGELLPSPIDVILSPRRTVVQPDLVFVARDRVETLLTDTAIVGAPDMVVEILSPSTAQLDRTSKRQIYAQHGVAEYWLVDVDAQILELHTLSGGGYVVAGAYTPGAGDVIEVGLFAAARIPVAEIWAGFEIIQPDPENSGIRNEQS